MQSPDILQKDTLILIIGDVDTGKTTLCQQLAQDACEQGWRVGLVDTDIGQSWLGPPTTIGAALWERGCMPTVPEALYFVGAITPEKHIGEMVAGSRLVADLCWQRGADLVIVDSTGFVSGPSAWLLKQLKTELLKPDHILALQRGSELEPLLNRLGHSDRQQIHRLARSRNVRRKSRPQRRRYRDRQLAQCFEGHAEQMIPFDQVAVQGTAIGGGRPASETERNHLTALAETPVLYAEWSHNAVTLVVETLIDSVQLGRLRAQLSRRDIYQQQPLALDCRLLGLVDTRGGTLGIGLLRSVDWEQQMLAVVSPVDGHAVRTIQVGAATWNGAEQDPVWEACP